MHDSKQLVFPDSLLNGEVHEFFGQNGALFANKWECTCYAYFGEIISSCNS
jgi:hypothetical protein